MLRELDRQKYENIHHVVDRTIDSYKRKRSHFFFLFMH